MGALRALRASMRRYLTCSQVLILLLVVAVIYVLYRMWMPSSFSAFPRNTVIQDKLKILQEAKPNHLQSHNVSGKLDVIDGIKEKNAKFKQNQLDDDVHIMFLFTKAKLNMNLQAKFRIAVGSMIKHASVPLLIHILGDSDSQKIATEIIESESKDSKATFKIIADDIDAIAKQLHDVVKDMQQYFSYKPGAYYSDALFFISIALHKVMPDTMKKAILLDADIKFQTDIKELFAHFNKFSDDNIIGIAREMQPVYKHNLWKYRKENPNSRVGMPPPDGITGFNSGIVLLNVEKIRKSKLYNSLIQPETVKGLTEKYYFKGHLGDQDFFSLLSFDNEQLFYILPCTWNRQLCQWWKDKGYADIFHLYYECKGDINIYHGNCNTPIP